MDLVYWETIRSRRPCTTQLHVVETGNLIQIIASNKESRLRRRGLSDRRQLRLAAEGRRAVLVVILDEAGPGSEALQVALHDVDSDRFERLRRTGKGTFLQI